jgi:hypothetical protein
MSVFLFTVVWFEFSPVLFTFYEVLFLILPKSRPQPFHRRLATFYTPISCLYLSDMSWFSNLVHSKLYLSTYVSSAHQHTSLPSSLACLLPVAASHSSTGLPAWISPSFMFLPSLPLVLLIYGFSDLFMLISLYLCWVLCCGFQLNPKRLGFRLIVCDGDLVSVVLSLFNLFSLIGSWIRSKYLGILLLQMVLSILVGRGFHWLHSQVTSTFLGFLQCCEVRVVCLN